MGKFKTDRLNFSGLTSEEWPEEGSYIFGIDLADNKFKKIDSNGNITAIESDGGNTFESKTFVLSADGTSIVGSDTGITLSNPGANPTITIPTTKRLKLARFHSVGGSRYSINNTKGFSLSLFVFRLLSNRELSVPYRQSPC